MPAIPAPGRQRQEGDEFGITQGYILVQNKNKIGASGMVLRGESVCLRAWNPHGEGGSLYHQYAPPWMHPHKLPTKYKETNTT